MNAILAETVNAKVDTADIFFLLGMILIAIGALLAAVLCVDPPKPVGRWGTPVAYLGLACVALGLWVL